MTDSCGCPPQAGSDVCELPTQTVQRTPRVAANCPECGKMGKRVHGQTIKALLAVSLRQVRDVPYLFCKTETCPVVYFSADGVQTFTTEHVRERVYQKEPAAGDVLICYCFHHTVRDLQTSSAERRISILDDIDAGIAADQCACDLRNPQGSCCLGNVRSKIRALEAGGRERQVSSSGIAQPSRNTATYHSGLVWRDPPAHPTYMGTAPVGRAPAQSRPACVGQSGKLAYVEVLG